MEKVINDAGEQINVPISETLQQRGNRYGSFDKHAEVTQMLKRVFYTHLINENPKNTLTDTETEAIDMIMHKLGRIANGDPHYDDSWRDIAGYAQLVADHLVEQNGGS